MQHCIVIGAGHGGTQAAFSLRQEGFSGSITLVSDESFIPYHKPPLSKAFITATEAKPLLLRSEKSYTDNRIDLRLGQKVGRLDTRDRRAELAGGSNLPFDFAILATGARARLPSIAGIDLDGVYTLRNLEDARRLAHGVKAARTIVIIGGGFIGMELAFSLSAKGVAVTVLEATPRILGRSIAPETSNYIYEQTAACGLNVITNARVAFIRDSNNKVASVHLDDDRSFDTDAVVVGAGAEPNVEIALSAGLAVDNGIVVDRGLRSSQDQVAGIGDCVNFPHQRFQRRVRLESVQNATDQAKHIARRLTGRSEPYSDVPWFWSDLGRTKLQMVGLAFDADRLVVSGRPDNDEFSVYHFCGPQLLAVDSVNRPLEHMVARRLIAQDVSPTPEQILAGPEALKSLVSN